MTGNHKANNFEEKLCTRPEIARTHEDELVIRTTKNQLWTIPSTIAQCDAWFSALYKYSYLLTYLLTMQIK